MPIASPHSDWYPSCWDHCASIFEVCNSTDILRLVEDHSLQSLKYVIAGLLQGPRSTWIDTRNTELIATFSTLYASSAAEPSSALHSSTLSTTTSSSFKLTFATGAGGGSITTRCFIFAGPVPSLELDSLCIVGLCVSDALFLKTAKSLSNDSQKLLTVPDSIYRETTFPFLSTLITAVPGPPGHLTPNASKSLRYTYWNITETFTLSNLHDVTSEQSSSSTSENLYISLCFTKHCSELNIVKARYPKASFPKSLPSASSCTTNSSSASLVPQHNHLQDSMFPATPEHNLSG